VLSTNSVNSNHMLTFPFDPPIGTGDGIVIDPSATTTTLTGNTANRNERNGITALGNGGKLTSNTARYNGRYGIQLGPLQLGGSGNRASGNALGQCLGTITCLP
jgi:parallel beta-helix repeat protein